MAQEDLERLVGRAILDPEFRQRLFVDPERAIQEGGFDLTPEEVELVKSVDKEKAGTLAEEIGAIPESTWK
jgi:hypothetical protein